jgi:hypothetical protein
MDRHSKIRIMSLIKYNTEIMKILYSINMRTPLTRRNVLVISLRNHELK